MPDFERKLQVRITLRIIQAMERIIATRTTAVKRLGPISIAEASSLGERLLIRTSSMIIFESCPKKYSVPFLIEPTGFEPHILPGHLSFHRPHTGAYQW